MSAWVDNQLRAAFSMYRRYLAMGLHFRSASAFDYHEYNGATNATFETFRKNKDVRLWWALWRKVEEFAFEVEFLFANMKVNRYTIHELSSTQARECYEDWKAKRGSKILMEKFINEQSVAFAKFYRVNNTLDLCLKLLDNCTSEEVIDLLGCLLVKFNLYKDIKTNPNFNALHEPNLNKAYKVGRIYLHLNYL